MMHRRRQQADYRPEIRFVKYDIPDGAAFVSELKAVLHPLNWRGVALFCNANRHHLRDERECNFVSNMLKQTAEGQPLTWRQQRWLRDIRERLLRVAEDR
jgi:hypothetical protein